jgi:hypothetical protein
MSTTGFKPGKSKETLAPLTPSTIGKAQGVIIWSSLFLALLQSVCSFFAALEGLRLLIGLASLAVMTQAGLAWDRYHTDWIRIPMIGFALVGSVLNLVILAQIQHLRKRPASQWRQQPLTLRKRRMERTQLILSLVTLTLIALEELGHLHTFHHL